MEITHYDGETVDTDKLSDVDALLLEESAKLYELFSKYNRQILLIGEMKGSENSNINKTGTTFFHIAATNSDDKVREEAYRKYISRIHRTVYTISNGYYGIAQMSIPES